jgi:hypothetical protein
VRPEREATPVGAGAADEGRCEDLSAVSVEGETGLVQALATARPFAFLEAVCSCGSLEVMGRCVWCGDLVCGSCAVGAGDGVCCEGCWFGRAVG